VNPAVSPQRILTRLADHKTGDTRDFGGRPGLLRLLVSYFFAASLRSKASSVAGVTEKTSAQRRRATSRASAASQARSVGRLVPRPAARRRSTAFSCRSTNSSAFFAMSPRNIKTVRLSTRHVSK